MNKTKIIVVEDNIVYCEYVCNMLSREGYRNMKAYHLSTAKKHLQQATDNDIVVADLRLPDGSGIDLLCWMRKEGKMQPFIIMTDYAEVNTAVESMKLGSIDYIPKQLVEDKLVPLIRSILKERQAGQRRMPIFAREGSAFQKIMHRIRLVAATDMSVMIFGENGTGKEHIAHLLHDKSKRAGKPFVAVDCGSLSKELAPSAFFGHVKGAFTGADNAKKGYFHEAEGGTLFLDEVGNLALETQQMLLRAIQERRYRPVGDKADRNFNVRIIAATNEDLEVSVNEKRFRQDLLYRLHDFGITVPPLRDCQEDIMPLAEFFRDMANRELECSVSGFSSEARKALLTHAWPGNVRELRQKVMGAVLQAQEGVEELDKITHGCQEGDLITIAGRTAIGKSSLALSMVKRIAIDRRMPVIYISPSMTGEKIVKRLLSIVCRIPLEHIVSGMLSVEEWENLERGSAALRDSPIYIFDTPCISIDKLEEQVHMFCKQNKAKAVFIDYLQLIQSKGNTNWTRNDEVTDVVCRLKSLAMILNVPFIILSQTNRPEHKENTDFIYTPKLSDLRDSGTIEDVSDMVMFIHRPEYYQVYQDEYGNDLRGITELYIEKNLTGHRHRIRLKSNYDIASFESVQTQHLSFDSGQASPFGIF